MAGLRREGPSRAQQRYLAAEPWHLWPEHLEVLSLWREVQTQWVTGPVGATGLSYPGVWSELGRRAWGPARRRDRLFGELKTMERAALAEWARQRKENPPSKPPT